MTTTSPFLPSFRELSERLDALADTPEVVAHLRALDPVSTDGKSFYQLHNLAGRVEQLHTLCVQWRASVRYCGTPPAPPAKPPKQAAQSAKGWEPPQRLGAHDMRPPARLSSKARQAQAASVAPAPRYVSPRAMRLADIPAGAPTSTRPDGLLTLEQVLHLCQRTASWLHVAKVNHGFPRPARREGRRGFYSPAAVQAWMDDRNTLPVGRGQFRPLGPSDTRQAKSKSRSKKGWP